MFSFHNFIDLPLIWFGLIATALFLYVLLDGFDLGVGILFPFAPTDQCRDRLMNSIAPFWDGNETWLVLSGGGLLAAFPLAYAILMPAFYIPVIIMLLGLIFRGVAFEFRFKADKSRILWDRAFNFGSITAALMQGVILGAFVQGVTVEGRNFSGGSFDWLNAYSLMSGVGLVFGYALLGSTWLVMKTDGCTQQWARKSASYMLGLVALFWVAVNVGMPVMDPNIKTLWLSTPNLFRLLPIPLVAAVCFGLIWFNLCRGHEHRPFFLSIGVFLSAYIWLGASVWPWLVPFHITFRQAAASGPSQSLLLIGTVIMLPMVLTYTAYCYYVFRGKASHEGIY